MYLLLLLQRWLWCSVFYSFLPDPLFCSPDCTLLPTKDLFFNFLQFEFCSYIPTSTWLLPHLLSSKFAFDLYEGQRFHKWVWRICLIIKMREYKMILQQANAAYFFVLLLPNSFLVVFKAFTFIFYWKKLFFFFCLVLKSSITDLTAKATKFVTIILATYIFFSCHCVYHYYIYEPLIIPFCPMHQILSGNCSVS